MQKLSLVNNTFIFPVQSGPEDRIQIEVGDSKQPDFKPQFKLMRWDNEVNFSMRAAEEPGATWEEKNGVIRYAAKDYEVHQYDKPDASKEGGFEFEWLLLKKPATNKLTATLQTKNLVFYRQPELTSEEKAEGIVRPENVVGSYAVYHAQRPMTYARGKLYRTGKAFHIYRPLVTDAAGHTTTADIDIDAEAGILTVTIPQQFLNACLYPVLVDPTFGKTSVGGTEDGSNALDAITASLGSTGVIQSISNYCYCDSGTHQWTGAVYADSAGVPGARLVLGIASGSVPVGVGSVGWVVSPVSSSPVLPAATYHPGGCFDVSTSNLFSMYYDATVGTNAFETGAINAPPPDPFGAPGATRADRTYSMYVTYRAKNIHDIIGGGGIVPFLN